MEANVIQAEEPIFSTRKERYLRVKTVITKLSAIRTEEEEFAWRIIIGETKTPLLNDANNSIKMLTEAIALLMRAY